MSAAAPLLARDISLLAAVTDEAAVRHVMRNALLLQADAKAPPLADEVIDLTVSSPIYGARIAYAAGGEVLAAEWPTAMEIVLAALYRVTKPSGRLALNVALDMAVDAPRVGRSLLSRPTAFQAFNAAIKAGWLYAHAVTWDKDHHKKGGRGLGSVDSSARPYMVDPSEVILFFTKGEWAPTSDRPDDITSAEWQEYCHGPWRFPGLPRRAGGHPAAYPEELPRRCIRLLSRPGDVVYDPFAGTGTTVAVAVQEGRLGIGSDISVLYLNEAAARIGRVPLRLPLAPRCTICHGPFPRRGRPDRVYCSRACRQAAYRRRAAP
jgi:DNA modification methylase